MKIEMEAFLNDFECSANFSGEREMRWMGTGNKYRIMAERLSVYVYDLVIARHLLHFYPNIKEK